VSVGQIWKLSGGVWTARGRSAAGAYNPTTWSYGAYGSYKPGPSTSGIPSGSPALTTQNGTSGLYIAPAGTYDLIDFHCEVQIRTPGAIFSRCKFRGNSTRNSNGALAGIGALAPYGAPVAKFYDCDFAPDTPSIWWDAIMNHDYEAYRCKLSGQAVDGFGVYGSGANGANVKLYGNYADLQAYFSPDPNHSGDTPISKTHNDSVQWQGGSGLVMVGNNFAGYLDAAIGEAAYSSSSPNASGGGPNNPSAGSGYNVNFSDFATYGKYLIDGANLQVSGSNGGECAGLDCHHNWFSGANRMMTLSQAYAALGTIHDNVFTGDYRAGVAANIPTGMDGGLGSGKSLIWYNNVDLVGSPVPVFHT
jgi:hypothetical protein